jgi:hypothetical protein
MSQGEGRKCTFLRHGIGISKASIYETSVSGMRNDSIKMEGTVMIVQRDTISYVEFWE